MTNPLNTEIPEIEILLSIDRVVELKLEPGVPKQLYHHLIVVGNKWILNNPLVPMNYESMGALLYILQGELRNLMNQGRLYRDRINSDKWIFESN